MSLIYYVECDRCGDNLNFKARLDTDEDLFVTVEPCERCLEEVNIEVRKELEEK